LLAGIGYSGFFRITLDHGVLDPFDQKLDSQLDEVARAPKRKQPQLRNRNRSAILLDALHKQRTTLVSPDLEARARRIDFLKDAIDIAARLNPSAFRFGPASVHDGARQGEAFSRLVDSLRHSRARRATSGVLASSRSQAC